MVSIVPFNSSGEPGFSQAVGENIIKDTIKSNEFHKKW
jgi:hypothetical protein